MSALSFSYTGNSATINFKGYDGTDRNHWVVSGISTGTTSGISSAVITSDRMGIKLTSDGSSSMSGDITVVFKMLYDFSFTNEAKETHEYEYTRSIAKTYTVSGTENVTPLTFYNTTSESITIPLVYGDSSTSDSSYKTFFYVKTNDSLSTASNVYGGTQGSIGRGGTYDLTVPAGKYVSIVLYNNTGSSLNQCYWCRDFSSTTGSPGTSYSRCFQVPEGIKVYGNPFTYYGYGQTGYNVQKMTSDMIGTGAGAYLFYGSTGGDFSELALPDATAKDQYYGMFRSTTVEGIPTDWNIPSTAPDESYYNMFYGATINSDDEVVINYNSSLTSYQVDQNIFYGCKGITEVNANVNYGASLFKGITTLKRINFKSTGKVNGIFQDCTSVESGTLDLSELYEMSNIFLGSGASGNTVTVILPDEIDYSTLGADYYSCNNAFNGATIGTVKAKSDGIITIKSYKYANSNNSGCGTFCGMFAGANITNWPKGFNITSGSTSNSNGYGFWHMFYESNIVDGSIITITNTPRYYDCCGMFQGCKSLTKAPSVAIGDVYLSRGAMANMFQDCTSLRSFDFNYLSDTITSSGDYSNYSEGSSGLYQMFYGCVSLTHAPELRWTNVSGAFTDMFRGCLALVEPPIIATDTYGRSAGGPYTYKRMFYGCSNLKSTPTINTVNGDNYEFQETFYGCTSLENVNITTISGTGNYCCSGMFNGCTSLKDASSLKITGVFYQYCFQNMFNGCTSLETVSEDIISGMSGFNSSSDIACCSFMFNGCTSLTTTLKLPSTSLVPSMYGGMFNGCTSLKKGSYLPSTSLAGSCYSNMYKGCTSLQYGSTMGHITTTLASCCSGMYNGCTSLESLSITDDSGTIDSEGKTVIGPTDTTPKEGCFATMFNGCTKLGSVYIDWTGFVMNENMLAGSGTSIIWFENIPDLSGGMTVSYTKTWIDSDSTGTAWVTSTAYNAGESYLKSYLALPSGWTVRSY